MIKSRSVRISIDLDNIIKQTKLKNNKSYTDASKLIANLIKPKLNRKKIRVVEEIKF